MKLRKEKKKVDDKKENNKEDIKKKEEKSENEEDNLSYDTDEQEEKNKLLNKKTKREKDQSSSSENEDDGYNSDEKAEIRAIAKKMLRKKERLKILNSSYNRYAFEDDGKVPKWFLEDENKHNKPQKPVTKAEILAEKEYLRKITVRMPKKILEAKARKKNRLNKRLQKIKKQAEGIANQDEYTEISKVKQIEKLYKREINKSKEKKRYIISRSWANNKGKDSRNVRHVDRRMKKDKRAIKAREKRNKKYKRRR
jgi:AdoMet-dependent rRNA methyltransferase SPB1